MRKKRTLVRMLTRVLYAGGLILLVSGLILSAASSRVMAASSAAPQSAVIGSSLVFSDGCDCSCQSVNAAVCNFGSEDMKGPVQYDLFFSPQGNPLSGTAVQTGSIPALKVNECTPLNYVPSESGHFAYRVYQESGAIGFSEVWSNACLVGNQCFPNTGTPTLTPTGKPVEELTVTPTVTVEGPIPGDTVTPTVTVTNSIPVTGGTVTPTVTATIPAVVEDTVTPTVTRAPRNFNLSAVCGYATDDFLQWKVANATGDDVSYSWRVSGSDERGSGSVRGNGSDYFITSPGEKIVRLYVNDELVDSQSSEPACKTALQLSYTCTAQGKEWYVTNTNSFSADFTWELDSGEDGSGTVGPGDTVLITVTPGNADRTLTLTWTDDRPGQRHVSLRSREDCPVSLTVTPTVTGTPTFTPTIPLVVIDTVTPTVTNTVTSTVTNTPTVTLTPQFNIVTVTPTVTNTVTNTPTVTRTITLTPQFVIITNTVEAPPQLTRTVTRTTTLTPQFGFVLTPSGTAQVSTATRVPTFAAPVITVTRTPALVPVTGVDLARPVGANTLAIAGNLLTNTGLFVLGLALAVTALGGQMKE